MRWFFRASAAISAGLWAWLAGCAGPAAPTEPLRRAEAAAAPVSTPAEPNVAGPTTSRRDAYVLLSGGSTPLDNYYSHYLQARAMTEFFERECPRDATWTFFGVGNRDGHTPVLADVRRDHTRDGVMVTSWLAGSLPRNRPATRESFLRAMREEILPAVRDGGTLFFFVGDHGRLAGRDENQESVITMWQMERNRDGLWDTADNAVLGVAELRKTIEAGIGKGRVVFGMTQCHSGGFHELGLAREMVPPSAWFTAVPAWATGGGSALRLPIGGFTATDKASPAAGCDPEPDPEQWRGYERWMPEGLLGIDLMTGERKSGGTASLAAAHVAATLVDDTIDKPRSTAEHYLERWAALIETRLADAAVTPAVRQAAAAYQRAVDRGEFSFRDDAARQRQAQFERFTRQLVAQAPATTELLTRGTRRQLESAIRGRGERGELARGPDRGQRRELRRAWTETLRPAWKAAVAAGTVAGLPAAARAFEQHLLKLEDDGDNFLLPRGDDDTPLLNEVYWNSGYAYPDKLDPVKAAAIARWAAERRTRIVAWGKASTDARIQAAAERIGPAPEVTFEPARPLSRRTAAERVLFYRRVLGAWQFLITLDAQPALAELRALVELEQTPLRRAGR